MPREQTELPLEFWVRVQADGLAAVIDYDSTLMNDAQLAKLGKLLQPYLRGTPEEAPIPAETIAQPSPPDTGEKPLWRRLLG